jgi:hypothetical protein
VYAVIRFIARYINPVKGQNPFVVQVQSRVQLAIQAIEKASQEAYLKKHGTIEKREWQRKVDIKAHVTKAQ